MHLCTKRMLIAVLFVIAKNKKTTTNNNQKTQTERERGNNTNVLQEQNKLWYVCTMELYIAMKI